MLSLSVSTSCEKERSFNEASQFEYAFTSLTCRLLTSLNQTHRDSFLQNALNNLNWDMVLVFSLYFRHRDTSDIPFNSSLLLRCWTTVNIQRGSGEYLAVQIKKVDQTEQTVLPSACETSSTTLQKPALCSLPWCAVVAREASRLNKRPALWWSWNWTVWSQRRPEEDGGRDQSHKLNSDVVWTEPPGL